MLNSTDSARTFWVGVMLTMLHTLVWAQPGISVLDQSGLARAFYQIDGSQLHISGLSNYGVYDVLIELDCGTSLDQRLYADHSGNLPLTSIRPLISDLFRGCRHGSEFMLIHLKEGRRLIFQRLIPVINDHAHPASSQVFNNIDQLSYSFAAGAGKLVYPSSWRYAIRRLPLALIAHGNGFSNGDYAYLANHLAANGFVVAVIQSRDDAGISEREADIHNHLNHVGRTYRGNLRKSVALIGHSRGGEAVIRAAATIQSLKQSLHDIQAVVSLAPSCGDPIPQFTNELQAPLLMLYGSHDDDVTGSFGTHEKPATPFRYVDSRSNDTPGFSGSIYIEGAGHAGFTDLKPDPDSYFDGIEPTFSLDHQRYLTKAYVTSFLRWFCRNETEYATYLLYPWESRFSNATHLEIEVKRNIQSGSRLIIEDFEDSSPTLNSLGGNLNVSAAYFEQGPLHLLDKSSPHDTRGAIIGWKNDKSPSRIRLEIPAGSVVGGFRFLSFQIAQVYKDDWNHPDLSVDFHIGIETIQGETRVKASNFGWIGPPMPVLGDSGDDYTKTALSKIKIPIHAFGTIEPSQVRSISFIFDISQSNDWDTGILTLDEIAFEE